MGFVLIGRTIVRVYSTNCVHFYVCLASFNNIIKGEEKKNEMYLRIM